MSENLPWIEKYRPKSLNDVINHDEIVSSLKRILRTKAVPHMLFAGPPGTGKTATAHAFARDLYGPSYISDGLFVEINASVTPDTPLLVRMDGKVKKLNFKEIDNLLYPDEKSSYCLVKGLEVLTVDKSYGITFKEISLISRHLVQNIAEIVHERGKIMTSLDHSIIVIDDLGYLSSKMAKDLRPGDLLVTLDWSQSLKRLDDKMLYGLTSFTFSTKGFIPKALVDSSFLNILSRGSLNYRDLINEIVRSEGNKVEKELVKDILRSINLNETKAFRNKQMLNLISLVDSPITFVEVKEVRIKPYHDLVYDVSVPGSEMFWGGEMPILLHNSDERGIDIIREKVKMFARSVPFGDVGFRIILMDESDQLTDAAQHAFRRTMEQYSATARFILVCNYSNRIIEPIQSRCTLFRFKPLPKDSVIRYLKKVGENEGLEVTDAALEAIYDFSLGDLRKGLNILQASSSMAKEIDEDVVYKVLGYVGRGDIRRMLELAIAGNFLEARNLLRDMVYLQGVSGKDIVSAMYREVFYVNIPEDKKVKLLDYLGEVDYRISQGASEEVQIMAFLARLMAMAG